MAHLSSLLLSSDYQIAWRIGDEMEREMLADWGPGATFDLLQYVSGPDLPRFEFWRSGAEAKLE